MEQITEEQILDSKNFIYEFVLKNNVFPLFLVESGSRMWEFASKDSDFDVRGLHIVTIDQEFSISKTPEQLEIIDDSMDIVSYNLDKYFYLLGSSNPNLLEQMQSNIVYVNNWDKVGINYNEFREKVFSLVNLESLYYHYLSMAHNNYDKYLKSGNKLTYKKVLYVLRSLSCAQYIIEKKEVPPVVFKDVISKININKIYLDFIDVILKKKDLGNEKTEIDDPDEIMNQIKDFFNYVEKLSPEKTGDKIELRNYLNSVAIDIKKRIYLK